MKFKSSIPTLGVLEFSENARMELKTFSPTSGALEPRTRLNLAPVGKVSYCESIIRVTNVIMITRGYYSYGVFHIINYPKQNKPSIIRITIGVPNLGKNVGLKVAQR